MSRPRPAAIFEDDADVLPADVAFDIAMLGEEQNERLPHDAEFDLAMFDTSDDETSSNARLPFDAEFDLAVMSESDDRELAAPVIGVDLASTPAFKAAIEEKVDHFRPVVVPIQKQPATRQYDFPTGQVYGPQGAVTVITIRPQCRFRIEKLMATDTFSSTGMGTSIVAVTIGQKVQKANNGGRGSLSMFFSQASLANGINFDTTQAWEDISLTVRFVQACTFSASLFGTGEIE